MTLRKKILILVDLLKKPEYNANITETEIKVSSITEFSSTAALNAVENKIANASNLVNKKVMIQK